MAWLKINCSKEIFGKYLNQTKLNGLVYVKDLTGQNKCKNLEIINGIVHKNPSDVSNIFDDFFNNVETKLLMIRDKRISVP